MSWEPPAETITTDEEFNEALRALLVAAHEGGVDVEGGWTCSGTSDTTDWEVTVVRLAESHGDGAPGE